MLFVSLSFLFCFLFFVFVCLFVVCIFFWSLPSLFIHLYIFFLFSFSFFILIFFSCLYSLFYCSYLYFFFIFYLLFYPEPHLLFLFASLIFLSYLFFPPPCLLFSILFLIFVHTRLITFVFMVLCFIMLVFFSFLILLTLYFFFHRHRRPYFHLQVWSSKGIVWVEIFSPLYFPFTLFHRFQYHFMYTTNLTNTSRTFIAKRTFTSREKHLSPEEKSRTHWNKLLDAHQKATRCC